MKILIGTKNKSKIQGARLAFEKYYDNIEIDGIAVPSNVSDEPINGEILQGAKNRIEGIKKYAKENNINADFYIAVEGGLSNSFGNWINVNLAAIENKFGNFSIGTSSAYQVPDRYIEEIRKSEVGKFYKTIFTEKEYEGIELDSILTHGEYTRESLVESAFIMALASQINGKKWI